VAGRGINRMKSNTENSDDHHGRDTEESTESHEWPLLGALQLRAWQRSEAISMVSRGIGRVKPPNVNKMQRSCGFSRHVVRGTSATIGWCARTSCAYWNGRDSRAGS
jgi:hypothetical protein